MPNNIPAILFVCTMNAVRSPMAAALARRLLGPHARVESAGVSPQPDAAAPDPLTAAVLAEIGITLAHRPRGFADLGRQGFDLVVALSPEARDRAPGGGAVEYWPLPDPTQCEGSREQRLAAYRAVRDALSARLEARFAAPATPET
jgi:protein-tyrosine-phosphatase